MIRLKNLLSDSSKTRRSRRNVLNIQITILGWLVEVLGFAIILVGTAIVGHGNAVVTMALQASSMLFNAILLPSTMLVNSMEVKDYIVESRWYITFINQFGCRPVYPSSSDKDDVETAATEHDRNDVIDEGNAANEPNNAEPIAQQLGEDDIDSNLPARKKGNQKESRQNIELVDLELTNDAT